MTINMIATGQNIRNMRYNKGLKIADLQDACMVSRNAICKWQSGESIPTIDNLVIIADLFGCKIDDIIVCDRTVGNDR